MLNNKSRIFWLAFLLISYFVLLFNLIILKDLPENGNESDFSFERTETNGFEKANFIPFKTIIYYGTLQEDLPTGIQNLGGNVVLFIPVGFLLTGFLTKHNVRRVLLFTLIASAAFELVQLFSGYGTCDVDDLLLNTIGGLLGYGLYFLTIKVIVLFRNSD